MVAREGALQLPLESMTTYSFGSYLHPNRRTGRVSSCPQSLTMRCPLNIGFAVWAIILLRDNGSTTDSAEFGEEVLHRVDPTLALNEPVVGLPWCDLAGHRCKHHLI